MIISTCLKRRVKLSRSSTNSSFVEKDQLPPSLPTSIKTSKEGNIAYTLFRPREQYFQTGWLRRKHYTQLPRDLRRAGIQTLRLTQKWAISHSHFRLVNKEGLQKLLPSSYYVLLDTFTYYIEGNRGRCCYLLQRQNGDTLLGLSYQSTLIL